MITGINISFEKQEKRIELFKKKINHPEFLENTITILLSDSSNEIKSNAITDYRGVLNHNLLPNRKEDILPLISYFLKSNSDLSWKLLHSSFRILATYKPDDFSWILPLLEQDDNRRRKICFWLGRIYLYKVPENNLNKSLALELLYWLEFYLNGVKTEKNRGIDLNSDRPPECSSTAKGIVLFLCNFRNSWKETLEILHDKKRNNLNYKENFQWFYKYILNELTGSYEDNIEKFYYKKSIDMLKNILY